jgi:hypothetical protein
VTTLFGDLNENDAPSNDMNDKELETFDFQAFDPSQIEIRDLDLKRGVQECVLRRHKQIQSSNHETVELLGIIPFLEGDWPARRAELCERKLHLHFSKQQRFEPHTAGAEWFTPGTELLDYIKGHTCPPENFDIKPTIGRPTNR